MIFYDVTLNLSLVVTLYLEIGIDRNYLNHQMIPDLVVIGRHNRRLVGLIDVVVVRFVVVVLERFPIDVVN